MGLVHFCYSLYILVMGDFYSWQCLIIKKKGVLQPSLNAMFSSDFGGVAVLSNRIALHLIDSMEVLFVADEHNFLSRIKFKNVISSVIN